MVAKSTTTASSLLTWLADDLREIVVTNTFAAAKHYLATKPDLLIAEVKLGEYNGLHLALRSRGIGVAAIVLGPADDSFRRQAHQLGSLYLTSPGLDANTLRGVVDDVLCRLPSPAEEDGNPLIKVPASQMTSDARLTSVAEALSSDSRTFVVH